MDVPQFIAGRFRIECEIGRGGMGTVYRATHLGLQRSVAVKIIKSEYVNDTDVADRFMRRDFHNGDFFGISHGGQVHALAVSGTDRVVGLAAGEDLVDDLGLGDVHDLVIAAAYRDEREFAIRCHCELIGG